MKHLIAGRKLGMNDAYFMALALEQAHLAGKMGEVPVGAVVVKEDILIAKGFNQPIVRHDPSAHAEILALRAASQKMGNYRLPGCTLYVTLEPCSMCAGAILHARLDRIVFGARDPKTGVCGSIFDLFEYPQLNHQTKVEGGVLDVLCSTILKDFFVLRRKTVREEKKTGYHE